MVKVLLLPQTKLLFFWILFLDLLQPTSASSKQVIPKDINTGEEESVSTGVIELTTRTFDSHINDGSSWMIEFYAPWCVHCQRLEPAFQATAKILHSLHATTDTSSTSEAEKKERRVKVAKIDGATERALASRFNIRGFPTIFLLDGWEVREYVGPRTVQGFAQFALEDYKKLEPIPFHSSPFGPVGQTKCLLMKVGLKMLHAHEIFMGFGMSATLAGCVLVFSLVIGLLLVFFIIGVCLAPKEKED